MTDLHGADLRKAYDKLRPDADVFMVLGDLDRIFLAEEALEILREDEGVIFIPGNHEYAHINHRNISSSTMDAQGIDSPAMWMEWDSKPEVKEAFASMFSGDFREKYPEMKGNAGESIELSLENGDIMVLMHAALSGSPTGEPPHLWNRLRSREDHDRNFRAMKEHGYTVMLRGHDHRPELAMLSDDGGIEIMHIERKRSLDIDGKTATITIGDLHHGHYAFLEDGRDGRTITFHRDAHLAFRKK